MIIPWVKIVWISDDKGYGLVATQDIPKGTVTFVQDGLDIVLTQSQLEGMNPHLIEHIEKYSYEDYLGRLVIFWDLGKHMNHDDRANTLTTGYGFEIAVRDIKQGEEVTDDYRIFSTHHDTSTFRKKGKTKISGHGALSPSLLKKWDEKVRSALLEVSKYPQPLVKFLEEDVWNDILQLKADMTRYKSVRESLPLKYKIPIIN